MGDVKTIGLRYIFLTLFMYVHIGITKKYSSFTQNNNYGKFLPPRR